ncbi:MAG: tetratricopeptide repeat protein [Lysobacterales bacterium]
MSDHSTDDPYGQTGNQETEKNGAAINSAIELHRAGDSQAAEKAYRAILNDQPEHFEALHFLGLIRQEAGDLNEALDLVEKAIELKPEAATYHATLGSIRFAQGDIPSARANYEQALSLNPNLRQGHNTLGYLQLQMGEPALAEKTFNTALRVEPESHQVYANLGQAALAQGRADDAVSFAQQALALDGQSLPARSTLADGLLAQGAFAIAEQAYRTCLQERAGVPAWVAGLADSLLAQQRADEARSVLHEALAEQPDQPQLRAAAGRAALALKHWHDAAEHFKQALLLRPGHPANIEGLGDALWGKGELAQAKQCFDAAASAVKSLRIRAELGDKAGALADLKVLLQKTPENAEAALAMSNIQSALGDHCGALATVLASFQQPSTDVATRNQLSLAAAKWSLDTGNPTQVDTVLAHFTPSEASDFDAAHARELAARALDMRGDYAGAAIQFQAVTQELTVSPLAMPTAEAPPALNSPIDDGREPPVVLTGVPGSGVDLLANILNRSDDFDVLFDRVTTPGERRDFLDSSAAGRQGKRTPEEHHRLERRAYWNAAERQRQHIQGRVLAVDYVPMTQLRAKALSGFLPGASVILAIRHPGDLLLHARSLGWRAGLVSADTIVNVYRSVLDCPNLNVYLVNPGALFDPNVNPDELLATDLSALLEQYEITLSGLSVPSSEQFLHHHLANGHYQNYDQNLALSGPALNDLAVTLGF